MTLNPVCENVETAQGVPLTVTGVAQVSSLSQGYDAYIDCVGCQCEQSPFHQSFPFSTLSESKV